MMNQTDLIIIYLACGAPFGVYYFLQNRRQKQTTLFWLKTTLAFILWLPLAARLFWNKFSFERSQFLTVNKEKSIFSIQKQIEAILLETDSLISIYNFREVFERYAGLTAANFDRSDNITDAEKEIFRISKNSDIELAAICQYRRNRKKLFFHHTLARQDFLNIIAKLSELSSDKKKLGNLSVEFVKLLNDIEAENALEKIFTTASQTDKDFAVKHLEKDLWNPEIQKPLPINPIPTRFQTMSATTNLRSKD
jgi:hypothetical protein